MPFFFFHLSHTLLSSPLPSSDFVLLRRDRFRKRGSVCAAAMVSDPSAKLSRSSTATAVVVLPSL